MAEIPVRYGVGACIGLAAVIFVVVALVNHKRAGESHEANEPSHGTDGVDPKTVAVADLGGRTFKGTVPLDAPAYEGSTSAFDAIANFEWAKKIGSAWSPDAILYQIKLAGCDRAATLDLSRGASVEYDFQSGSLGPKHDKVMRLYVSVKGSGVAVRMTDSSFEKRALTRPECPLDKALGALDKAGKLPKAPPYSVALYVGGLSNPKTKWVVSDAKDVEIAAVDATSCQ